MTTSRAIKSAVLALSGLAAIVTWAEAGAAQEPVKEPAANGGALAGHCYRVVVSTDIGGTDPDDFQSVVHLLVYADCFDIEGLVSSPYGPGRKKHILEVINCYEKDYANLKTYSDTTRFRFCPKAATTYRFTIRSNVPALDGKRGGITVSAPTPSMAHQPSSRLPNWWTDDLSPGVTEGSHSGAKTVSRWREEFLRDFAARMLRCQSPASTDSTK